MSDPLFFSDQIGEPGETVKLKREEAHHAHASRRLRSGDTLWLFDGRGVIARASCRQITERGRQFELRIEEKQFHPPSKPAIHLACAVPKGDRQTVLLDMATQLGMTSYRPLTCEHSVVKPSLRQTERWSRTCLESCKQSRRLHLPAIQPPVTPAELAVTNFRSEQIAWIVHPSPEASSLSNALSHRSSDIMLLIGPEGGFTDQEVRSATEAGARIMTLGEAILRIETAAATVMAAFRLLQNA